MPAPGEVLLGKYQIERVLGQGGMGIVVSARHLELGELFAIKLLLPQALRHPQAVPRFLREARAAARLRSEHVVKVVDVGRLEDGAPYMVMEHLRGSDLKTELERRGPLPVEEAVSYVLQCCEAIAEAHALGIIHRDIKPANLFLTRRLNGSPCVKVLDFGISKQSSQDGFDLTKTGNTFGSPLYMAPEQMARTKDADARSDIWSLGVVLYELLTGRVPFWGETVTEVVAAALQREHVPPSHLRPEIPASLDATIDGCLQKRPDSRFQRIEGLAAALRAFQSNVAGSLGPQAGMTVPMPPPLPPPPLESTEEPFRAVSSPALVATAALPEAPRAVIPSMSDAVAAVGLAPIQTTDAPWGSTSRTSLPPAPTRWRAVAAVAGGLAFLGLVGGVWLMMRNPAGASVGTTPEALLSTTTLPTRETPTATSPVVAPSAAPTTDTPPGASTPFPPGPVAATGSAASQPAPTRPAPIAPHPPAQATNRPAASATPTANKPIKHPGVW